jgi:hypothetical protein
VSYYRCARAALFPGRLDMLAFRPHLPSSGWTSAAITIGVRWMKWIGAACCVASRLASGQVVPGHGIEIGSVAAERARLREIVGQRYDSLSPGLSGCAVASDWRFVRPTIRLVRNSALPASGNDADLWAGRGTSASVNAGIAACRAWRGRSVEAVIAPTIAHSENLPFFLLPGRDAGRSAFSSPWHLPPYSADLPLRFGDLPVTTLGPGQSSITMRFDRVVVGVASTNEWWGPAIRNTLLLGSNAPGVPRLLAQTARPIRTRFGDLAGRAFIGGLSESPFFDDAPHNDVRALNGALVTFRPAIDTGLTIGLSRLVTSTVPSWIGMLPHALDVLVRYEQVTTDPDSQSTDQLLSLFGRWVFPESGFETYVEWARTEFPRSLGEFVTRPQNTQGYTIGLQWTDPARQGLGLRLQGEVTYLEQTQVVEGRPPMDFYTGRAAQQGFTERGQILGASIGPGASSQFLGADWVAARWQLGGFVTRVRTENDAMYREFPPRDTQHDVTLQAGARAAARLPGADVRGELAVGKRHNYLFRSDYYLFGPVEAIDVRNVTFSFTVEPR